MIEEKLKFFRSKPSPLDSSRPSRKREGEESGTSKRVSEDELVSQFASLIDFGY